jgi:hypothetical protein
MKGYAVSVDPMPTTGRSLQMAANAHAGVCLPRSSITRPFGDPALNSFLSESTRAASVSDAVLHSRISHRPQSASTQLRTFILQRAFPHKSPE